MQFWSPTAIVIALVLTACGPGEETTKDSGAPDDMGVVADMMVAADTGGATDTGGLADMRTGEDVGGPIEDSGGMDAGAEDAGATDAGGPDMSACSRQGFVTVRQTATFDVPNDQFIYTGFDAEPSGQNLYAFISFEVYPYLGGTVGAQTYDFPGENYEDCSTCLLIFADCKRPDPCEKVFLVDTGQVVVDAADTMDGATFQATFRDIVLKEVTIDPDTFTSTPVENGETWCLDGFPANTTIDRVE